MSLLKSLFGKKTTDGMKDVRVHIAAGDIQQAQNLLRENISSLDHAVMLRELLVGEREHEAAADVAKSLAELDHAEGRVSRALLAHLEGNFRMAVDECEEALALQPELATAHNHLARALHNMGQVEIALNAFRRAVALRDDYAEAWHNLGHALRSQGQVEQSIEPFQRAVALSPGYRLARLNLGITLFNLDRGVEALACFDALLAHDSCDAEAMMYAGLSQQLLGRFEEARQHFRQAIELAPDFSSAHFYLGVLLNERTDTQGALAALERALQLDAHNIDAWIELAGVCEQSNQLEKAEEAVRKASAIAPDHPALQLEEAKLERRRGDTEAAAKRLHSIDPGQLMPRLAQQYFFELGTVLDRVGDTDNAFNAFTQGKMLAARNARRQLVDHEAFPRSCERQLQWLVRGAHGAEPSAAELNGDLGEDLCFLLGFPRSGTTLLDTMLDVHSDVVSIEERATLEQVINRIGESTMGYPEGLGTLSPHDIQEYRKLYRSTIKGLMGDDNGKLIIDKLPMRSLHAALIHRLFPKARILFALRHPCDVVLSNFMQNYAVNEAFVHFDTIEECCASYDRVLRVWEATEGRLSLQVSYLRYEALIATPAETLAQVCDFLGIESLETMLDTDARMATRDRVRTNSYQQVAEPIYQRAAGRWQRYRKYLEPHFELLRPHAERFGYSLEKAE